MKKILLLASVVLIAGCHDTGEVAIDKPTKVIPVIHFTTPEGLRCVTVHQGLSCDWERYNEVKYFENL